MLLVITLLACLFGASQGTCPPAEWIAPLCTCENIRDEAIMTCNNFYTPDDVMKSFETISKKKYHIGAIKIENSSLLYIPHDAFQGGNFQSIMFFRSQIMSLSDTDNAFEGLEETLEGLSASESSYVTQWDWQQLRRMEKLRMVDIKMINLGSIDDPFPAFKNLKVLSITKAGISYIVDGAFDNLSGLQILTLKDNDVQEITRSMLPNPAPDFKFLDLSNNKIRTVPKDFFQNLPSLKHVYFENNRLIVLPEDTFKWAVNNLRALLLKGNNFICDCRMRWLTDCSFPNLFTATCERPTSLAGKRLADLEFKELNC